MKKFSVIIIITALIAAPLLYLFFSNGYIWFVYPDKMKYSIRGIDISHHQGEINWEELKTNSLSFIFIKATEGDDHVDHKYPEYAEKASEIGLKTGAYHFYSLRIPGSAQARNFINTVNRDDISLPPAIDLEFGGNSRVRPTPESLEKDLNEYIKIISEFYGSPPLIYTTYEFNKKYLEHINISGGYYLWIRNIFFEPDKVNGKKWTFWQYKSKGRVKGINGFTDMNVFGYSGKEFEKILLK